MPWMKIHFLSVFKEHDVTLKEMERFQDVNVSANWSTLDYLTNCNKKDLQKTIRTNCIYHSSANIISQLFCQKNMCNWKRLAKKTYSFSLFSIYIYILIDYHSIVMFVWCLLSNLSLPRPLFYVSAKFVLFECSPGPGNASSSSEEKQEKWHLALLISGQPPDTNMFLDIWWHFLYQGSI